MPKQISKLSKLICSRQVSIGSLMFNPCHPASRWLFSQHGTNAPTHMPHQSFEFFILGENRDYIRDKIG
jgi:hypothetical protein